MLAQITLTSLFDAKRTKTKEDDICADDEEVARWTVSIASYAQPIVCTEPGRSSQLEVEDGEDATKHHQGADHKVDDATVEFVSTRKA